MPWTSTALLLSHNFYGALMSMASDILLSGHLSDAKSLKFFSVQMQDHFKGKGLKSIGKYSKVGQTAGATCGETCSSGVADVLAEKGDSVCCGKVAGCTCPLEKPNSSQKGARRTARLPGKWDGSVALRRQVPGSQVSGLSAKGQMVNAIGLWPRGLCSAARVALNGSHSSHK